MTRLVVEEVTESSILDESPKVSSTTIVDSPIIDSKVIEVTPSIQPVAAVQFPTAPKQKKSCSPIFWIIIPGIFLLGAILGGIVYYQKGVGTVTEPVASSEQQVVDSQIPVSTIAPSASPSVAIDLTKYTISIFNGSGISGEAGRAKTLITTAGFKAGTTANAASYDYTKTIIKAKSTVEEGFITALSTALGKNYVVDTKQVVLSNSSADDVQVVVGSSKAE